MDPVGLAVGGLFDELVEIAVVHNPCKPTVEEFHVGMMGAIRSYEVINRNVDIGSLTGLVLGVHHSTYKGVEFGATIAGTDDDRNVEC